MSSTPDETSTEAPEPSGRPALKQITEPLEADLAKIVTLGTAVWLVLFVVSLPLHGTLADHGRGWWTWCALTGAGLGLLGLWYIGVLRRRHAAP